MRSIRHLAVLGGAIALVLASLPVPTLASPAATPPNDAFASAQVIPALPASLDATLSGATVQPAEKDDVCTSVSTDGLPTVWYTLTPGFTGAVRIGATSSAMDVDVSAYRGATLSSLVNIGCNSDIDTETNDARLTVLVTSGVPVRIRVTTRDTPGDFSLSAARVTPPSNDLVAAPASITLGTADRPADNRKASFSVGEKVAAPCPEMRATRWYRFTPGATKTVRLDTWGAAFDTQLAVYQKVGGKLVPVACSDDADDPSDSLEGSIESATAWRAVKGTTYLLQVGGYKGQSGTIPLSLSTVTPPANDAFANATVIPPAGADGFELDGSLVNATAQAGETSSCPPKNAIAPSLWWTWTPAESMSIAFQNPLQITVYTGGSLATLDEVLCTDGQETSFDATAGVTYRIRVSASSGLSGPFLITMAQK